MSKNGKSALISKSLVPLSKRMHSDLQILPYHFIELFIYFDNFIENDVSISKDSFITANSSLSQSDSFEDEEIDALSASIFGIISNDGISATVSNLAIYLKQIAISEDIEVNDDVLFDILDKNGKSYIDYADIEILVSSLEEFTDEHKDWKDYEDSYALKRIIKRNLSQNDLDVNIFDLFAKADNIINKRIAKSNSVTNSSRKKQTDNNNDNDNKIIVQHPVKDVDNVDDNNIQNKPLSEVIFDARKASIVHRIKMVSFLYDVTLKEFSNGMNEYTKETLFDKNKFISSLHEIIQSHTSNLFKFPFMKLALSMLFQIIDLEHKNALTYYDVIGGVFTLTKSTSEEKIHFLQSIDKKHLNTVISSMLSLYVNTSVIHDVSIFSEVFIGLLGDLSFTKGNDLLEWIFSDTSSPLIGDVDIDDDFNSESIITTESKKTSLLLESLKERLNQAKKRINLDIQSMSIIDVTYKLLKHSLLGEINNFQLSSLLDSILADIFSEAPSKEKQKAKNDCMEVIERYFDFSQDELIDVRTLHSFFILIFAGSTIEKMESIFIINDVNENESIDTEDLIDYFSHLFDYLLREMKISNLIDPSEIAREIITTFAKGKEKISLIMLVHFYENVLLDIHE